LFVISKKKATTLQNVSQTGGFRIQMRITGQENTKTYIPLFTLVDFEQSLKRKQSKDKSKPFC